MNNKIINVQFLRAFAASLVVFYHTAPHYFVAGGDTSGNIFSFMSQVGYAGVDIFFVISGYIMWYTTHHTRGTKVALEFIYARFTRIYPLYWSFFFLLIIMYWYKQKLTTVDVIGSFFLTASMPNFILSVAWTLQYELYFYLFFSLLLFVAKKYRIKIIIFTLFIIFIIQFYAIFHLNIYAKNNFHIVSPLYTFWLSPFIVEFFLGIFVAYYFEHTRVKYIFLLIISIFFLIGSALYYQEFMINGTLAEGYYMPQRVLFFGATSMLLLALMIELSQRNINILPKISKYLGDASYSLYLSHTILLLIAYSLGIPHAIKHFGDYQELLMLLLIVGIIFYSLLHYKFIESPLLKLSKKVRNKLFH